MRAENARLKDRVLPLQGQNRDYAERAVDDARRLAIQDEAIERLEHSVQAYQDERTRLEAAYKQLVSNLGGAELSKHEPAGRAEPKASQMYQVDRQPRSRAKPKLLHPRTLTSYLADTCGPLFAAGPLD